MDERERRYKAIENRIKAKERWIKLMSILGIIVLIMGMGLLVYNRVAWETRLTLGEPSEARVEIVGNSYILTYNKVEHASGYRYTINGVAQQVGGSVTSIDITNMLEKPQKYEISIQAMGNDKYKNSKVVEIEAVEVYKTLETPEVEIDEYESKLIWLGIEGADAYEVSVIENDDLSTNKTYRVQKTEFEIGDIIKDNGTKYSFTVKATAEDYYINQSASSQAVESRIAGRLNKPEGIRYDGESRTLRWNGVENAESYTIEIEYGIESTKKVKTETAEYRFSEAEISNVGEYKVYVRANNVKRGEDIWYLGSEAVEYKFEISKQLATPTNITYTKTSRLVNVKWDAVEGASSYLIELLRKVNKGGVEEYEVYHKYIATGTNEINIERSLSAETSGNLIIRIQAYGYNKYYLTSEYSEIVEITAGYQYGEVEDIQVLENGKYLTFIAPSTDATGEIQCEVKNGYTITISKANETGTFEVIAELPNVNSTIVDISSYITEAITYKITIKVNGYGYFSDSDEVDYIYNHQIQLSPAEGLEFRLEEGQLNLYFEASEEGEDIEISGSIEVTRLQENYEEYVSKTYNEETKKTEYKINYSGLYKAITGQDPLKEAQRYSAKIKVLGEVERSEEVEKQKAGYTSSEYSVLAWYENRIELETPEIQRVDTTKDEEVMLYFSQVAKAQNYEIRIESEESGETNTINSYPTTVNIYESIFSGINKISVRAKGTGYYIDSKWSTEYRYTYEVNLQAPQDVRVEEESANGTRTINVVFTSVRFAEKYEVQIRQTHRVIKNGDGTRVEEITSDFETIGIYEAGIGITKCEITSGITSYGRYEIRVMSVLKDANSEWSRIEEYNYYEQQPKVSNVKYNDEEKIISFDGVATANNGYVVRISYERNGVVESIEKSTRETRVSVSELEAGVYTIEIMTLGVEELYLSNSEWTDKQEIDIRYSLEKAKNFKYREETGILEWESDGRADYDEVRITFNNAQTINLEIEKGAEVTNRKYMLGELIEIYGYGYYTVQVTSQSNNINISASTSEWRYTQYVGLDAVELKSVTKVGEEVQVRFGTVANAMAYSILVKLPTQENWKELVTNIFDNGEAEIVVDIKQALINYLGANRYEIVVRADGYEYYLESISNVKTYELKVMNAPKNLRVTQEGEQYYAEWDSVENAESYTLRIKIGSGEYEILSDAIVATRYNITDAIQGISSGEITIGVKTNAIGEYEESGYAEYTYNITQKLNTPTLSYDAEQHTLSIEGQEDRKGYTIEVIKLDNGEEVGKSVIENYQGSTLNLLNHLQIKGVGKYKVRVKQEGDGIYYTDSDWAEIELDYTEKLNKLQNLQVIKENGKYIVVIEKPADSKYDNTKVRYKVYELSSSEDELDGSETPIMEITTKENRFELTGLTDGKYYIIVAEILGGYGSSIYEDDAETQAKLAYYEDSESSEIKFTTFGNALNSPEITEISINGEELSIEFNKVENGESYTVRVERESGNKVIYENANIVGTKDEVTDLGTNLRVTINVMAEGFTDSYDVYRITIYANAVKFESGDIQYAQSNETRTEYENIMTIQAPEVEAYSNGANIVVRIKEQRQNATGYIIEVTKAGKVVEYSIGSTGTLEIISAEYGEYSIRAKAIGDKYHKDSSYGEAITYVHKQSIGGVESVEIISTLEEIGAVPMLYAKWDKVEGATETTKYGVLVQKYSSGKYEKIYEDETKTEYYSLLNIVTRYGYGSYRVYVKTNGDGEYVIGESEYRVYADYDYKGRFATPTGVEILLNEKDTSVDYILQFNSIAEAESYELKVYNKEGNTQLQTITIDGTQLQDDNGKTTGVITHLISGVERGEYQVRLKVKATGTMLESGDSEAIAFTKWEKLGNPSLNVYQEGSTSKIRIEFNKQVNAQGYTIEINGKAYEIDGSTIINYPEAGYIVIDAEYFNIGTSNEIRLIMKGNTKEYYLDTIYTATLKDLTFTLDKVQEIQIKQTNVVVVVNGVDSQIKLRFNRVKYADKYTVYIDGIEAGEIGQSEEEVIEHDISSMFEGKMPKVYTVGIVAKSNNDSITESTASTKDFKYILQYTKPQSSTINEDKQLEWTEPSNLSSYKALAQENDVEIVVEYEIDVYCVQGSVEKLYDTWTSSELSIDLTTKALEPLTYKMYIKASSNTYFGESTEAEIIIYTHKVELEKVTNVSIEEEKLTFSTITLKDYRYAEQNVYYEVYVNDAYLQIDLPQKEGNYTIDLSKYLCGGDNYIYIYTVDLDTEHYISVYEKTQVEVVRNLPELASVGIYNERDKEYIQFGKYSVNGLTESEVDEIKYRVSVTNKGTGETQTKESTISRKDGVWNYIDISEFISTGTGIYEISIQALGYEKDKTTQLGDAITLRYGASAESKIEYVHKTYAETLELNVLVIDTEGNEREAEGGLEMSEMWLYFDMNLGEEYLSIAEELLFMLNINNRDYRIRIEYNNSYEGEVTGYVSTEDGVQIETRVVISRRTESGAEKVTISIEIIPMLKLGGFNIHKSGLVSMKARTEAQGNYFASNYQTKALEYEYMLRFKVPTGLEVVAREDGYYLKWDEPTHENIADYYSLIESYTLQIESKGVANDGKYSDPHGTKGKVYRNEKVAREEILLEEGKLYYYVGDKIFAGENLITLKANGNANEYYLESQASELEYTYIKRIEPVDYEVNELASNRTDEKADKGVEIIIRDVYTEQAQIGGVNYNSEALYRVKITSTSQKMSEYPNPSEADYMDYEVSVVVNKNGIVEVESGNGSGISVRYVKNNVRSYLEIIWLMKESGYYTYEITGLGRAENSTKDGERAQGAIVLTYIAPQLEMGIKVYDGNGLRTSTKNKISKIVITWQSEISKFYGVEYEISITSSITQETKTIIVKNVTSLVINEGTNKDLYEWISNKPSNYTIRVRSLEVQAPQVEGSEEKITYYLEGQLKEKGYTYLLDINAPEEISIYEVGNKTYLKMKIPERIKQAGIETETNKIKVSYEIKQEDAGYNVSSNTAKTTSKTGVGVKGYNAVEGGEEGYYYVDVTGQLYPAYNGISISYDAIESDYFNVSAETKVKLNYNVKLDAVKDVSITNVYNSRGYVMGYVLTFKNVQYNKYFAYKVKIAGTRNNSVYRKTLIMKVNGNYVNGSLENYKYVECYEDGAIVQAKDLYTRKVQNGSYVYTEYNYEECTSNYEMNCLVLIEGGIPDLYDVKITAIGEVGESSDEIENLTSGAKGTTTSDAKELQYFMKGTLRQPKIEVGTYKNGEFISSGNNTDSNRLAYIYDQYNSDNTFVYLEYPSATLQEYAGNVWLKITLEDEQAKEYYVVINGIREVKVELTIKQEGTEKVAYLELDQKIFRAKGQYTIEIRAKNETAITNEYGEKEGIYESTLINSNAQYVTRYDRVTTPELEYQAGEDNKTKFGNFIITNYGNISNVVGNSEYSLIIEYAQAGDDFSSDKHITINKGEFSEYGIVIDSSIGQMTIPESAIRQYLYNEGVDLGSTQIRLKFDVDEDSPTLLWDSPYSNGVEFKYRLYIELPTFASTKDEYDLGSEYSKDSENIYTNNIFNTNIRELATEILIKYNLVIDNKYSSNGEKWTFDLKVTLKDNSQKSTTIRLEFGNIEYSILKYNAQNGQNEGLLEALFGNNLRYGQYSVQMQIVGVYCNNVDASDKIVYDSTTFTKTFAVQAQLKAPTNAELNYDSDQRAITGINVQLPNSSMLSDLIREGNNPKLVIEVHRPNGVDNYELSINSVQDINYTFNKAYTISGLYYANVYIKSSKTNVIDSGLFTTEEVKIPFFVGVYSVNLNVDDNNGVELSVELKQANKSDANLDGDFVLDSNLDEEKFTFNVKLYRIMNNSANVVLEYVGEKLYDINIDLNERFNQINNNISNYTTTFSPGSYYIEISANGATDNGVEYEASSTYYAAPGFGEVHNTSLMGQTLTVDQSNILNNEENGFKCIYRVGYTTWETSYLQYIRNDWYHKGYVSEVTLTHTITESCENGEVLRFVNYQFKSIIYYGRSNSSGRYRDYTSFTMQTTEKKITTNAINNNCYVASYGNIYQTESNQGIAIYLYVSINDGNLNESVSKYIQLKVEDTGGNVNALVYSGVLDDKNLVPLQQRLPAPKLTYNGCSGYDKDSVSQNYDVSWTFNNNFKKHVENFKLEYFKWYRSTAVGTDTLDRLKSDNNAMEIREEQDLWWHHYHVEYRLYTKYVNAGLFDDNNNNYNYSFYDRYRYGIDLYGIQYWCSENIPCTSFKTRIQAISNKCDYADSVSQIIQNYNLNHFPSYDFTFKFSRW